jgi:acyl carrier protein
MERREQIIQAIYAAIDEVNKNLEPNKAIEKSPATVLAGEKGQLDSMGFVTLAVEVEKGIERTFKKAVSLMDVVEIAGDRPLTAEGLTDLVAKMLEP